MDAAAQSTGGRAFAEAWAWDGPSRVGRCTLPGRGLRACIMTERSQVLKRLHLEFNPFEPFGSGAPLSGEIALQNRIESRIRDILDNLQSTSKPRCILVIGDDGIGKTCFLQWLHAKVFREQRIKSFFFENPSVSFFRLANSFLEIVGRKSLAKSIWEISNPMSDVAESRQFHHASYEKLLASEHQPIFRPRDISFIRDSILDSGITQDEDIARFLTQFIARTKTELNSDYRDYLPRSSDEFVAESEEAPYFRALLKSISHGVGAKGIAFLIDEFKEFGLQARLTRQTASHYRATLKRLVNLSRSPTLEFWVFLSMTPEVHEVSVALMPSLLNELHCDTNQIHLLPLGRDAAEDLVQARVRSARSTGNVVGSRLFPFPEPLVFPKEVYSNPRRLVKVCCHSIENASERTGLPFSKSYLEKCCATLYPNRIP